MKPKTLYQLICEGPCNPDLSAVDVRMAYDMAEYTRPTPLSIRFQRRLRYTTHLEVGVDDYQCGICQTVRQWGHTTTRIRPISGPLDNEAESV